MTYGSPWNYMEVLGIEAGGSGGNRTHDQWIKSPVLYRLSYRPTNSRKADRRGAHDTQTTPRVHAPFLANVPRRVRQPCGLEAFAPQPTRVATTARPPLGVGLVTGHGHRK